MPIYEYACQKCGNVVEVFQKVDEKGPAKCQKCGGKLARVLSQTSFQLKGGGWYKDLYSSVKPGSDADKGETKPEAPAKTEAKPEAKSTATEAKPEAKPAAKAEPKASKPSSPSKGKKKARA